MPSYKDKDGRWRYRFQHNGKRYGGSTAKGNNTKRAADALEREHIGKLERREFTGRMPTIQEFSVQFLEYQEANTKPLTHELHETIVRVHVLPELGPKKLDEVSTATIAKLMTAWLKKPAGRRTVNTRAGVLLRMLALAVEWGVLTLVPKVKLLDIPDEQPFFLDDHQSRLLIDVCGKARALAGHRYRTMAIVALRTGLRIGEIRGLQWADVDLVGGAIRVRRTDPGRKDMDSNSPKSNKPRTVPLTDETIAALKAWQALTVTDRRNTSAWVFPGDEIWSAAKSRAGSTLAAGTVTTALERAIEREPELVKLQQQTGENIGWHTMRHTYASQLAMRGIPLRAIQELLGHASIKQTECYANLSPGFANRELVASLDTPLLPLGDLPEAPEPSSRKALPEPKRQRAAKAGRGTRRTPRRS
jgi:integrase